MRKMLSLLRRAIEDYKMIEPGDKIAIGLSGGKDSLTLLVTMRELQKFYPVKFDLVAITLDMGFKGADFTPLENKCVEIGVPFILVKTDIAPVVFDERKEPNPCSLCANMRRGALNSTAKEQGCNKIMLGHHFDDVIETFMLSLFYEGRVSCFSPVTYLSRADITLLRPLIYVPESHIKAFAKRHQLPVCKNPCKADGNTKRQEIKNLISTLQKDNEDLPEKLFGALCRGNISGFIPPNIGKRRSITDYKSEQ